MEQTTVYVYRDKNAQYRLEAYDSRGNYVGTMYCEGDEDTLYIAEVEVLEYEQRKGHGTAIYKKAIQTAKEDGYKIFASDYFHATSESAQKVWNKLNATRNDGKGPMYSLRV